MKSIKINLLALIVVFSLIACSSTPTQVDTLTVKELPEDLSSVFYFDFDKSDIKPEAFQDLDTHAEYIIQQAENNDDFVAVIEGHCDERGTIDYNFALGNRRAESIARYLRVKGVSSDNLSTESYGEERPAVTGTGEQAWSLNRRAEIVY